MCNFFVGYFYSKNTLFNSANELNLDKLEKSCIFEHLPACGIPS